MILPRLILYCQFGDLYLISVGGYISGLSVAFGEAYPGKIFDTQAVRHLITYPPNNWAICAEQTREYWGKPH